jgi:tetratricopeptide (TPR) repeat protein
VLLSSACSKAPIIYSPLKDMDRQASKNDKVKQETEQSKDLLKEDEKLYRALVKQKTIVENAEDEEEGDDEEKTDEGIAENIEGRDDFEWHKLGYQALNDKNWEDALNAFNKAIKLNPQYMEAYFHRGNVYDEIGDYEKAIVNYNRAIKLNPIYTEAYLFRGLAYNNLGKLNKAIADIKKAAKLGDHFAQKFLIKKNIPW